MKSANLEGIIPESMNGFLILNIHRLADTFRHFLYTQSLYDCDAKTM